MRGDRLRLGKEEGERGLGLGKGEGREVEEIGWG